MDHKRLIAYVKQTPQLWDRHCANFRNRDAKEQAWEMIANKMNQTVIICKESFKSLREKYLRERNKTHQYPPWDLLNDLEFLDPYIVARTKTWNGNCTTDDDIFPKSDADSTDFDRQLIRMVKKASPIWDRNSNTYPNKVSKNQLWEHVGTVLNRDSRCCMLRWKALREKYIRQKAKFQDGEAKWELLDDLHFLDKVIQYRRKHSDQTKHYVNMSHGHQKSRLDNSDYSEGSSTYIRCNMDLDDYSYTDSSSNDFISIVKEEDSKIQQLTDSSYNSFGEGKRTLQPPLSNEEPQSKKPKLDEIGSFQIEPIEKEKVPEKAPEQLFGDLVASLLSKKPENQRNFYMIEIMTLLSK